MSKMEILAPAGGPEQLRAAVRSGADAVYLGTRGFNARQSAVNFDGEMLCEAVRYCHARNVRVHVTLNTLLGDEELPALEREIQSVACSGADAVIVQDLAVAELVRTCCPELEMHASTQMTIHNLEGVRAAEKLGFSRVVLARELSLEEIRMIADHTPLELECFVHGALCMGMSGACYLSCALGGRSGNRGRCAQPCRLDFSCRGRSYALSLKDHSHLAHLQEMEEAGICSVKIEGRMKRPEYVAAAVSACVAAREGKPYDCDALEAVFSRSGFTDGYLMGKRNLSMFGVRREEDKAATERVCAAMTSLYRRERSSVPVDFELNVKEGETELSVSDGKHRVTRIGEAPCPALSAELDEIFAQKSLYKTGGTPFLARSLRFSGLKGMTVPSSKLSELRRSALEELLSIREMPHPKEYTPSKPIPKTERVTDEPAFFVRAETASQISAEMKAARFILPLAEVERHPELIEIYGKKLAAEVPQLVFPKDEERTLESLKTLAGMGLSAAVAENIGAASWIRQAGLTVLGGHGLNLMNTRALLQAEKLGLQSATLSFEMNMKDAQNIGGSIPRGILAYGHLPLMRFRCCPAQGANGCGACNGHPELIDRKGIHFPILCCGKRFSSLLNPVPLSICGRTVRKLDFLTLYFTTESPEECRSILRDFEEGQAPAEEHTTGLYYKKLL